MLGNLFVVHYDNPTSLTANAVTRFSFPFGVTLIGANASSANSTGFDLDVGTATDTDAYIDAFEVVGATATTVDIGSSDLVDGAPMHIPANTEIVVTVDFDATSGGDSDNPTVTLFFREG